MKTPPYVAPDFSLPNAEQRTVSLQDFRGQWLVVYFYPKDDTPGCTVEACSICDVHEELTHAGIQVVGISKDAPDSHAAFMRKHELNFELLSDESGKVIEAYGAWGKKMFGVYGIQRKTFVIDPNGMVVKVYGRVTPAGHGAQLLEGITLLQANG
ncbi:MAG TPA: thioredoxin-dependent thiol peroxidase [Patescibacteria group bacterium]|jgi:peroxiredoxin Q/BCP|nr:thioredoxin-dependent thiol peroxidase [Patescibacteria group bacterium]